jgi:hypothetical protein
MIACRWAAIGIALAAILDPAIRVPRTERPPIDVAVFASAARANAAAQTAQALELDLGEAGFRVNSGQLPVVRVVVADRAPDQTSSGVPTWAVDMSSPETPGIRISDVSASAVRAPGQAARVQVTLDAVGATGDTSEVRMEQDGIGIAVARHRWQQPVESWTATLEYSPPSAQVSQVTIRAIRAGLEDDGRVDIGLPGERSPFRVLVYETRLSWPATFVRRSLEGEPAFALSLLQRASPGTATRAGAPPHALSGSDLALYDLVVVGGPEDLTAREIDLLQGFVRDRGGAVAFIATRRPDGGYTRLLADVTFGERVTEQPMDLAVAGGSAIRASEILVAHLPRTARPLVTVGKSRDPVAFSVRRGDGMIIVSGALDAWRYRASGRDAFARFWQSVLSEAASSAQPRLSVQLDPGLVQVGRPARVRATLRATELSVTPQGTVTRIGARVVGSDPRVDDPLRLWPSIEPGVFEGEWTPTAAGRYMVTVASGGLQADAVVLAANHVARGAGADPEGLALAVAASGGLMRSRDRLPDLVSSLAAHLPARDVGVRVHPMRSPWWSVPFAFALCIEWGWRRLHGAR